MRGASRFAHADGPVSLARHLEALKRDPGVDQRRDPCVGVRGVPLADNTGPLGAGEQRGNALGLELIHQAGHHRANLVPVSDRSEIGDRIEDNHRGLELVDRLINREKVRLEPKA